MSLADVQATKRELVAAILSNPTYTPESGVYQRLHARLIKLAKDDLSMLKLLIELKVEDASGRAWTDNGLYHAPKSFHPHVCAGCTADESKHGKPVIRDN